MDKQGATSGLERPQLRTRDKLVLAQPDVVLLEACKQ